MKVQTLINEFLEYLEIERGRSLNTVRNYNIYLKRFADWAKVDSPKNIDLEMVRKYRLWLNRGGDNGVEMKMNTQNYHLIALRAFLKYLAKRDIQTMAPEKIELAKMPDREVEFLHPHELRRLLEAPLKTEEKEVIKLRDKAIIELLFSSGLRVSELADLKKDQVHFGNSTDGVTEITIRGKGKKLRIVFVSDAAKTYIKKYLEKRGDTSPALFVRHDFGSKKEEPKNLTPRSIQRIIHKYARDAGITKKVTPHTLRHTFATDLLLNGADIRSVQAMLGHSSITTTQIYTHITNSQLRDVHKNFHKKKKH